MERPNAFDATYSFLEFEQTVFPIKLTCHVLVYSS